MVFLRNELSKKFYVGAPLQSHSYNDLMEFILGCLWMVAMMFTMARFWKLSLLSSKAVVH